MPDEIIIDDSTSNDVTHLGQARGLVPRNYTKHPVGSYGMSVPFDMASLQLVPRSEFSDRIKEKIANKSQLSDIRNVGDSGRPIPSLDQNGQGNKNGSPKWGYCWAHSSSHAITIIRARDNQPYVPLSAFAVAATIKNGRNEGGWGAQSLDFIVERGIPAQSFWPQKDDRLSNGTPECWENAALHKITEGWVDLNEGQYDRNLTFDQMATCLLNNIPVVTDFNWWGHSVLAIDLVEVERGSFGIRIWNSWGDSWSENGTGILRGNKAVPDGSVAPRVATLSQV